MRRYLMTSLLRSSRYVGSATSIIPCSIVPWTAAVSTGRLYASESGQNPAPNSSARVKQITDQQKADLKNLMRWMERHQSNIFDASYYYEDMFEEEEAEFLWDRVPVLESELEPALKDSILEFGKYNKVEAELLPSIQKLLMKMMLSGEYDDLVLVKNKETGIIVMTKRWKVFRKYAYFLPDELTENLVRMDKELQRMVAYEDLSDEVEILRLLTDHWKKALMNYLKRLEADEEESKPEFDVVPPSAKRYLSDDASYVLPSARPYMFDDAWYALLQLELCYEIPEYEAWHSEFMELMEKYLKGHISRYVLPDLITQSILKFNLEEINNKWKHLRGDIYAEKEVKVLMRGWLSEVGRLNKKYWEGTEDVLLAFRKKLVEMRLSGKHDDIVARPSLCSYRPYEWKLMGSRANYFDDYAAILPHDVKEKLLRKLRSFRDVSWELDEQAYEQYRDFENGILMDYLEKLKVEHGTPEKQFHMDYEDDEKNTREMAVKYEYFEL
ncbi:unnamed protein product [Linum trigynum]|uniref:Uncharacterized protein n=1 Tax=Linum trigynum TaxID=586398 RepID=A0AAV2GNZ0_9ROSI